MAEPKEKTIKIKIGGKDVHARGHGTMRAGKVYEVSPQIAEFFIKRKEVSKE